MQIIVITPQKDELKITFEVFLLFFIKSILVDE